MAGLFSFWQLLGTLDAVPELDVTWDPALLDEPDTGQYWAYVHADQQPVAKLSSSQHMAFVLPTAPPIVHALLAEEQLKVVRVVDLAHPTVDITRFLQSAVLQKATWGPEDAAQFERGLQEMNLRRNYDEEERLGVISDEHRHPVAIEHFYFPFALMFKAAPADLDAFLREHGLQVLTIDDWDTPNLSIDAAALPGLTERLSILRFETTELEAFSAELLTYWLR